MTCSNYSTRWTRYPPAERVHDVLADVPALVKLSRRRVRRHRRWVLVDGVFGSYIGIDSTAIWTSATSGKSVLRTHLLVCMLARTWSPQEHGHWPSWSTILEMGVSDQAGSKCMQNPCFAVSGVKLTSIDCWEEILNPPSGLLVLHSAPATLVVDGETSRGRHCTPKKI